MVSDINGDQFPRFEVAEAERARVLCQQLSQGGESDIADSRKCDSSSEEESEEEPDDVWTKENLAIHVDDIVQCTGPLSGVPDICAKIVKETTGILNTTFE